MRKITFLLIRLQQSTYQLLLLDSCQMIKISSHQRNYLET
ncbi:unnamed protein product [Paramecium octaurelia]|uniref:Uncharacterized protein n=1 Tax=Paramecium octaurelia TaxID=43137 RepID=A0A8S1Y596_PAROT|nr:unnamed protein product [Paramecium octaurelia]